MLKLDTMNVNAADDLYAENVRSAAIDFHNAKGRHKRFEDAMNAHADIIDRYRLGHEDHFGNTPEEQARREAALERYKRIGSMFTDINLDKNFADTAYVVSDAAAAFSAQAQVRQGKFQKWFDMTVPTQDVVNRLEKFTSSPDAANNIDAIIAGCRILNQRGDGKLLREAIESLTSDMKIEVGSHAAQSLAGFLMFEVKDNDPFLRRFGKYINLETARYYNSDNVYDSQTQPHGGVKRRRRKGIDLKEYVQDGYEYEGVDDNGQPEIKFDKAKRGMTRLLMGTSFKGVEREAYLNVLEGVASAFKRPDGTIDYEGVNRVSKNVLNSIMPNVVGDYSNYASGSEQVNAFATFITGKKIDGYNLDERDGLYKPNYVWDDKALAMMDSPENSKHTAFKRVKSFMDALVINQATRMKTDVLYPVKAVFKSQAEEDLQNPDNEEARARLDKWREEEAILHVKTNENGDPVVSDVDRYSHWLFRDSLKPTIRGGLAQNITSGFQSDTKDNFLEAMGYKDDYDNNELITKDIERFAPKRKRHTDDDNGQPATEVEVQPDQTQLVSAERAQWVQGMREAFHDFNPALAPAQIQAVLAHALNSMDNPELGLGSEQKQMIRDLVQTQNTNTSTEEIISAIENIINS